MNRLKIVDCWLNYKKVSEDGNVQKITWVELRW